MSYTPRHATGTGRHRSGESAQRSEKLGGYVPTHGQTRASGNKRAKASHRAVAAGKRSKGFIAALWALGDAR